MAARLEKIASKLGRVVVASSAFAARLPDDFTALGAFELAGFREAQTVYGLREDDERAR
jgi:adenylate cyclase